MHKGVKLTDTYNSLSLFKLREHRSTVDTIDAVDAEYKVSICYEISR